METWDLLHHFLSENSQKNLKKDKELLDFIQDNNLLSPISVKNELEKFFDEAEKKPGKFSKESSLLLENSRIKAAPNSKTIDLLPAIIIDAGGTNLRIVGLKNLKGKIVYDFYEKRKIPGLNKAITAQEFFAQLASFIVPVLKKPSFKKINQIKFCFSYPFTIDENAEARAETLSKEICITDIQNAPIGSSLKKHIDLQMPENCLEEVIVLNDTVATLLASYIDNPLKKSGPTRVPTENHSENQSAPQSENHSEIRLGIVIGTGFNIAYQKQPEKIDGEHEQEIVNTEIGRLNMLCHSVIDKKIDQNSRTPGLSILEKAISGAYLGKWAYNCLDLASSKGLIKKEIIDQLGKTGRSGGISSSEKIDPSLKVEEITDWLFGLLPRGEKNSNPLALIDPKSQNGARISTLLNMTLFRSASLAAFATYALISWMSKGENPPDQVILSVNGSIVTKTPRYLEAYQENIKLLSDNLMKIKTVIVKDAPTLGSLYAQNIKNTKGSSKGNSLR